MACTPEVPATRDEALPLLVPVLRPRVTHATPVDVLPVGGHLVLRLGVERSGVLLEPAARDLARWGLRVEEAFDVARGNLRARSGGAFHPLAPAGPSARVRRSPWRDGGDGARVALPALFADLGVDGPPVVVAPRDDLLLVAGARDEEALASLLQATAEAAGGRALSPMPVTLCEGAWQDWRPPAGSALTPLFRRATTAFAAALHARQQAFLLPMFELEEELADDLPVPVEATVVDLQDGPATHATWTRGGPASLPVTDCVTLVDDVVLGERIPWARLVEVCGRRLEPLGLYPPRVVVRSFPTGAELDRLGCRRPTREQKERARAERLDAITERESRECEAVFDDLLRVLRSPTE